VNFVDATSDECPWTSWYASTSYWPGAFVEKFENEMHPPEGDWPANDSASGERTTTDVYALPYPQPDTTNGVPYGMLDPLTLASWNETERVGADDDGFAAFDAGTSSVAAAAASATKRRRFLDIWGLLAWRKLPWLPTTTPWRRRLERDDAGRVLPPSFVLRGRSALPRRRLIPRTG
jgi:hypothetical protein